MFLRTYRADKFPTSNNDDGLFYVWAGNSFFASPFSVVSHSIFEQNNAALTFRNQFEDYDPVNRFGMKIVRPWFDHPPLGPALISLPARALGYTDIEQIPHLIVRAPALIASVFTMLLTFLVATTLFGESIGLYSLVFLATVPYFVFAQRQSYLENFLTPIFMLAMWLLLQYQEKKKMWLFILCMVFSASCGWIKIPAFSVPFMVAVWLFHSKEIKKGFVAIGTGVLSIGAYLAYGFISSSTIFLQTITNQGVRGAFAGSFYDTLTNPHFYTSFTDGWYVLGLIFGLFLLMKYKANRQHAFYSWFLSAWLIVLFLVSGRLNNSPWYKYQLIPFMAIALGFYAKKFLDEASLFLFVPFYLFGLMGFELLGIPVEATVLRLATLCFAAPFALSFMFEQSKMIERVTKLTAKALFVALIVLNIVVSIQYPFVYCQNNQCIVPERITVGK